MHRYLPSGPALAPHHLPAGWSCERHVDIDAQAAALTGWHLRYLQLSAGRFEGAVQRLQLEGVSLFAEDLRQSVHQSGWVRPDVVALGVPVVLEGEARFCGRADVAGALHVFSGADGFEFRSPQRHVMVCIEIERALFEAHVLAPPERGAGPSRRVDDRAHLRAVDPVAMDTLRRFLLHLFASAAPAQGGQEEGGMRATDAGAAGLSPRGAGPRQHAVRTQLLDRVAAVLEPGAHEGSARAAGGGAGTVSHAALCARATAQVADRLGDPPSVAELCTALGVSRRTLQSAFQSIWGMGPLAWLTTLRLNAVRRELKQARSVTEAATQFGFWHFGHFADDYRALFDELPSQTLRRHRGGAH